MVRIISFILFAVFTVDIFFHGISPKMTSRNLRFSMNTYSPKKQQSLIYDMYGNEIKIGRNLTVSNSPVYILYD